MDFSTGFQSRRITAVNLTTFHQRGDIKSSYFRNLLLWMTQTIACIFHEKFTASLMRLIHFLIKYAQTDGLSNVFGGCEKCSNDTDRSFWRRKNRNATQHVFQAFPSDNWELRGRTRKVWCDPKWDFRKRKRFPNLLSLGAYELKIQNHQDDLNFTYLSVRYKRFT